VSNIDSSREQQQRAYYEQRYGTQIDESAIWDWSPVYATGSEIVRRSIEREAAEGQYWLSQEHFYAYVRQQGFGKWLDFAENDPALSSDFNATAKFLKDKGLILPPAPDQMRGGGGGGGITTEQEIDNMMADMRSAALLWNVRIDDGTLRNLATTAVNQNWNRQRVLNGIGAFAVGQDAQNTNLDQGPLGNAVRDMAKQYGVAVSDTTVKQLLQGYVQGTESEQSITAKFQQQAIAAYPALSERLRQGETFEQVITPYREVASRVLEKDPSQLDFVNSNLSKAFMNNPDGKGERQMSVGEFSEYLRTNREFGYEYTTQAQTKAYQIANTLAQVFGRA